VSLPKHPTCNACRYWERFKPRGQTGVCHAHPEWSTQTYATFYCADHDPKGPPPDKETR